MSAPITLPPELVAEVAEDQDRFRPEVDTGQAVLVLAVDPPAADERESDIWAQPGVIYPAKCLRNHETWRREDYFGYLSVRVDDRLSYLVPAWALVGTADDPASPRPAVGGRVLVTEWAGGGNEPAICIVTATERQRDDVPEGSIQVREYGGTGIAVGDGVLSPHWHATAWAILPPSPADPGAEAREWSPEWIEATKAEIAAGATDRPSWPTHRQWAVFSGGQDPDDSAHTELFDIHDEAEVEADALGGGMAYRDVAYGPWTIAHQPKAVDARRQGATDALRQLADDWEQADLGTEDQRTLIRDRADRTDRGERDETL